MSIRNWGRLGFDTFGLNYIEYSIRYISHRDKYPSQNFCLRHIENIGRIDSRSSTSPFTSLNTVLYYISVIKLEASPMSKKNLRRINTLVSAQTLYHLENMRSFCGFNDIGRVIDKLVREKQIELNEGVRNHALGTFCCYPIYARTAHRSCIGQIYL